ncbi:cytochrome c biogenesis protein CcsA [Candidatus Binatia bacterium]|nr:cytochrome c biogenesis protein CcsA [Candidatus Binatia bacterium]
MSHPLLGSALALYLIGTVAFLVYVTQLRPSFRRLAHGALVAGFAAHAGALAVRAAHLGYDAIAPFQEGLSFVGCLMVGLYLALAARRPLTIVGALVTPLAFLFALSAYLFESGAQPPAPTLQSLWLPAHVVPAFAGYAVFALAFCLSLAYLLQERQLKGKRRNGWFRHLPSLETLDNLNFRFVSWGFGLLTIGLITGSLLAREKWGELWSWEPVQVWSLITWFLYAILLHARTVGWRGRKAARLTVVGFVFLVASFLSVNLLTPGKHGGTFG